jgi:glyoxylase-like metal-dependent hydrolase (beta-lactamase superfamily II)
MAQSQLYLKQIELGPMQNFVYLVGDQASRECVVVDPAWEIDGIADLAAADDMRLTGALVTHTHQDHVGGHLFGYDIPGVEDLLAKHPMKVYVHKDEREFLKGYGSDLVQVQAGDTLQVGKVPLTFIHTPGHTPGSQCFLVDGCLISGDTLFIRSCAAPNCPATTKEMYLAHPAPGRCERQWSCPALRLVADHHRRRAQADVRFRP